MAYSARSVHGVATWDACAFPSPRYRRSSVAVIGAATVASAWLIAAAVGLTAAWTLAASLHARFAVRTMAPMAFQVAAAFPDPSARRAAALADLPRVLTARDAAQDVAVGTQQPDAWAWTSPPVGAMPLSAQAPLAAAMRLPPPPAKPEAAAPASDRVAALPPPQPAAKTRARSAEGRDDSISLPDRDSRTAIYDIAGQAVYLPNGDRLEAHSGLGSKRDDPRYVSVKNRGATPPNTYRLVLREQLFHGVRAIRLVPASDNNMFGRDGILAHSYMLGPSGQSNGCISFRNYPAFLRAFLNGEVERLVVVARLHPGTERAARARRGDRVASNER